MTPPIATRIWVVWYETRPVGSAAPYRPTRVTVAASGACDAFAEAARELPTHDFELGWPVSAEPLTSLPARVAA